MARFPIMDEHKEVTCFNCKTPLLGHHHDESGYAPRFGEHRQWCKRCQMYTYYDIHPTKKSELANV